MSIPHPLRVIYEDVSAKLTEKTGAECLFHGRENAKNGKPPRYVWIPGRATLTGARAPSQNPRIIAQALWEVAIVCWGTDADQAFTLGCALLTCIERSPVVKGRNYEADELAWTAPSWVTLGEALTASVKFLVAIPEYDFDGASEFPGDARQLRTVPKPLTDEPASPALSTPSDGTIESNEP